MINVPYGTYCHNFTEDQIITMQLASIFPLVQLIHWISDNKLMGAAYRISYAEITQVVFREGRPASYNIT